MPRVAAPLDIPARLEPPSPGSLDAVADDGGATRGAPLGAAALLAARAEELWANAREGARDAAAHSFGFASRLLAGVVAVTAEGDALGPWPADDAAACVDGCRYGGAPDVARLGFAVAAYATADRVHADYGGMPGGVDAGASARASAAASPGAAFLTAADRLRGRSPDAQEELALDDVALLGLADGLAACGAAHIAAGSVPAGGVPAGGVPGATTAVARPGAQTVAQTVAHTVPWLLALIDGRTPQGWTGRLRALAGDLLDGRGRLRRRIDEDDPTAVALDLVMRRRWPAAMADAPHPSRAAQQDLLAALLRQPAPPAGALEQTAVWLAALDGVVAQTAAALVPNVGEVARILRATQGALKRWVWEPKAGRKGVAAARWLIDDEAHVQALLWTILGPYFGEHLRDEQYLPGYGLKQPRADFGIVTLKLIVEVKIARAPADFRRIEEEVAGDLGLYFSDPARYDRMLVYVYDDADAARPELYESLRTALTQRDARVEDVIVVRRPGMIPDRGARG